MSSLVDLRIGSLLLLLLLSWLVRTVSWTQLSLSLSGPLQTVFLMHPCILCVKTVVTTGGYGSVSQRQMHRVPEAEWSSRACFLSGPRSVVTRQYHPRLERSVPCFTYRACLVSKKFQISRYINFWHIHETLNVDKKIKLITQFSCKSRDESFKLS
jgi:hypothetical protein